MASDDSKPKIRMLLTIGIVSVMLLTGIKFVLDSYYLDMTEGYARSMLPKTEQLDQTRKEQTSALEKSDVPIGAAMQTLAQKGRDNAGADITPQPSDDIDALKGWAKTKHEVHLPPQVLTTATAAVPLPPVGDAGANVATTDGGVTTTAGDAGASKDGGAHNAPHQAKDGGK